MAEEGTGASAQVLAPGFPPPGKFFFPYPLGKICFLNFHLTYVVRLNYNCRTYPKQLFSIHSTTIERKTDKLENNSGLLCTQNK